MQSLNGAQFLNITFLFLLPGIVSAAAVFGTVIVRLTSTYAHYNHINLTLALKS